MGTQITVKILSDTCWNMFVQQLQLQRPSSSLWNAYANASFASVRQLPKLLLTVFQVPTRDLPLVRIEEAATIGPI